MPREARRRDWHICVADTEMLPKVTLHARSVLHAVRRDCEAILSAAELSADEVISAYPHAEELLAVTDSLPRWKCGECAESFRMFDGSLDNVAAYYRKNGCGMFARYKAFVWRDGDIRPVLNYDTISLDEFTGYESQRDKVVANSEHAWIPPKVNYNLLYA